MGSRAIEVDETERVAVGLIAEETERRGWSGRRLAAESGITKARIALLLRGERPTTMSDFDAMCRALGLRASEVIREAEAVVAARGREPVPRAAEAGLPPVWELAASDHGGWEAERREREGLPVVEPEDESQVLPDDVD